MEEIRLQNLGLSPSIVAIAQSLRPPSQTDLQQVGALYQDASRAYTALRVLIQSEGDAQSLMLKSLKQAEAIAMFRMRVCLSIRASWRKLPLEIWDRIYNYYLDGIRNGSPGRTFDDINKAATSAPGNLCLVSRFWRAVAQATPSIWKDVTLPTVKPSSDSSSLLLPGTQVKSILSRLNRVARHPHSLSLTIAVDFSPRTENHYDSEEDDDGYDSYYETRTEPDSHDDDRKEEKRRLRAKTQQRVKQGFLIEVLLQSHGAVSSAERVCLSIPSNFRRYRPIRIGDLTFASATSLVIIGPDIYPEDADSAHCFPALKRAVLIGVVDSGTLRGIPAFIPWGQLTRLLLGDNLSLQEVYSVLRLCTSLEKGSFWMKKVLETTPAASAPSTLPHLAELALIQRVPVNMGRNFFNGLPPGITPISFTNFAVPALTRLDVFADGVAFSPFTNLTHLRAVGVHSTYTLQSILDGCPFLVELLARISVADPAQLNTLVFYPGQPRGTFLQIIALTCSHMDWEDAPLIGIARSLYTIASSRSPEGNLTTLATLKRFIIRYDDLATGNYVSSYTLMMLVEETKSPMLPLVARGLEVSVGVLSALSRSQDKRPWPRLHRETNIKHWDAGMDVDVILEDHQQYTTSLDPPDQGQGSRPRMGYYHPGY